MIVITTVILLEQMMKLLMLMVLKTWRHQCVQKFDMFRQVANLNDMNRADIT